MEATPAVHCKQPPLELWIVRHGETDWNRRGIIQGQSESTLSELGAAQAGLVAVALAGISWWRICSSDLRRCRQTVELVLTPPHADDGSDVSAEEDSDSSSSGLKAEGEGGTGSSKPPGGVDVLRVGAHVVRLDSRLREMSAGIYEGLPRGTAYTKAVRMKAQEAGLSVEAFTAAGSVQGHEDPAQFQARAAAFLDWVEEEYMLGLSHREAQGAPEYSPKEDSVLPHDTRPA